MLPLASRFLEEGGGEANTIAWVEARALQGPARGQQPTQSTLTTVLLIRVVSTVVNAVALSTDPQTYPVVLAAERSVGGTLEFHCTSKQKQTVTVKGDAIARLSHLSQAAARPLPDPRVACPTGASRLQRLKQRD